MFRDPESGIRCNHPGYLTVRSAAVQNPSEADSRTFLTGLTMRTISSITVILIFTAALALPARAQQNTAPQAGQAPAAAQTPAKPGPKDTEVWEPVPPVVTPGAQNSAPPSDA